MGFQVSGNIPNMEKELGTDKDVLCLPGRYAQHKCNKACFKREAASILGEMLPKTRTRLLKLVQMQDGSWNVQRKPKAIARYVNRLGFMLLLTNKRNKSGQDILMTYRSRDAGEKLFDNIKNALNNDRLRIDSFKAVHFPEGELMISEISKRQRRILQLLRVQEEIFASKPHSDKKIPI